MNKKNKLYKILSTLSILGFFVTVAVIVLGALQFFTLNSVIIEILGIIIILCLGCIFALPWVNKLEEKKNVKLSIVFLISTIVCAVLWIVSLILIMNIVRNNGSFSSTTFNIVKISLILSIQFLVASRIAYIVMRYKKSMIIFQVITYLSLLYIDFYFSYIIISLKIADGVDFSGNSGFIFSKIALAILIISFIYTSISNAVIKSYNRKHFESIVDREINGDGRLETTQNQPTESVEERIKKLKDMYEKDLITKEEYEQKKEDILKEL